MRWFGVGAALVLVLTACEPRPSSPPRSDGTATTEPSRRGDLSFPGGGEILFIASKGPGYAWRAVGIVGSGGDVRRFRRGRHAFPSWDPVGRGRVLLLPYGPPAIARSLESDGDRVRPLGSWRTAEVWTLPSLDGETLAFTPIAPSGRPREGSVRLVDRRTGRVTVVPSKGLVPLAWTPDGELLAVPRRGGGHVRWDPRDGDVATFGPRHLVEITWDPAGRRYAGVVATRAGERVTVVIGRADGRVLDRIAVEGTWVDTPTWSPEGDRIAFVARGVGPEAHRRASLHVYDVGQGGDEIVAEPVSHARWASWSPDGRWLLVEDWTRERWLFVSASGDDRLPYPWLGAYPRWCCPSSPPATTPIPVS